MKIHAHLGVGGVPGLLRTRQTNTTQGRRKKCKTKAKKGLWPAGSSALTLLPTSNPQQFKTLQQIHTPSTQPWQLPH
jgi:hypothetical protein